MPERAADGGFRLHRRGVCPGHAGGRKHPVAQPRRPDQVESAETRRTSWASPKKTWLAYLTFSKQHWTRLHSANPIERLNGEIKRRTEVVGIFPKDDAIVRLVGALLLEQNDEWPVQRSRYLSLETIAAMSDNQLISLPKLIYPVRKARQCRSYTTP